MILGMCATCPCIGASTFFGCGMKWVTWVPLGSGGLLYLYMGSTTALGSSTWVPCASTWALQTELAPQETSKRPPGQIVGAMSDPAGRPWRP